MEHVADTDILAISRCLDFWLVDAGIRGGQSLGLCAELACATIVCVVGEPFVEHTHLDLCAVFDDLEPGICGAGQLQHSNFRYHSDHGHDYRIDIP